MFSAQEVCTEENADLNVYPQLEPIDKGKHTLIVGDLHSNALKLVRILIKHNRLIISPQEYAELVKLYKKMYYYITRAEFEHYDNETKSQLKKNEEKKGSVDNKTLDSMIGLTTFKYGEYMIGGVKFECLTGSSLKDYHSEQVKADACRFVEIIQKAAVNATGPIIFLGDDVRDRGLACNFVTDIYAKLTASKIPYSITLSNHGLNCVRDLEKNKCLMEFAYEKNEWMKNSAIVSQYHSFNHMALMIKKGILDEKPVLHNLEHWKKKLKLVDYIIDKNDPKKPVITLCTHAPIGTKTLKALAQSLGVKYDDQNIDAFSATLDKINIEFTKIVAAGKLYKTADLDSVNVNEGAFIPFDHPIVRTLWNRQPYGAEGDEMPDRINDFYVRYVHGHHQYPSVAPQYEPYTLSLDDRFGSNMSFDPARCRTLCVMAKTPVLTKSAQLFQPPPPERPNILRPARPIEVISRDRSPGM